jgi:pimeloyl-ACP methyl ester carboxylesterase
MSLFVVAHGAWSAGWAWKKMHPLMQARGHRLITPTYTGLGERAHLAHSGVDLETHIADVVGVLEMEDLRDVMLIGHSYGGMVATGIADRAHERIAAIIYIDAFAPRDGDSALSLLPPAARAQRQPVAANGGEAWQIPPGAMPADTSDEDRAWAQPRRRPQPLRTFEQKLRLHRGEPTMPRHYIYCARHTPDDRFRQFYDRAGREGWGRDIIDASHNPHITVPEVLADLLDSIVEKFSVRSDRSGSPQPGRSTISDAVAT